MTPSIKVEQAPSVQYLLRLADTALILGQRLGDGTDESARRMRAALDTLWRYSAELFESDEVDAAAAANGLGPRWDALREPWLAEMQALFAEAKLQMPAGTAFRSTGKRGVHSEHMGYILSDMQYLQRAYPGGAW